MVEGREDPFSALEQALQGKYILYRELGRGGMGIVYLAREVALKRQVALKLVLPAKGSGWREQLRREAEIAAGLTHPNIVPVHAVDSATGPNGEEFVYYTMAYVEGETLAQRIRDSKGGLPVGEATQILYHVAQAVAFAHGRGVTHRDLKPENIVLERSSGRPMVLDFGIAQVSSAADMAKEGYVAGSAEYMSPEVVRGGKADARSDIYSLGVTAYCAATGRLPFKGATTQETFRAHVEQPLPPWDVRGPGGDTAFRDAVERCLAKDPAERFASVAELVAALEKAPGLRREMPVPLRAMVRRLRGMHVPNIPLILVAVWMGSVLVRALPAREWIAAMINGLFVVVVGFEIARLLRITRRVLAAGYGEKEIVDELKSEHTGELEWLKWEGRSEIDWERRGAWGLLVLACVVVIASGLAALAGVLEPDRAMAWILSGSLCAVAAMLIIRARHRPDETTAAWVRFWNGRGGALVLRIAGWGLGRSGKGGGSGSWSTPGPKASGLASVLAAIAPLPAVVTVRERILRWMR